METLFDLVLGHLVFGCVAVPAAALGLRMLQRSSASVRHMIWLIVLMTVLIAPALSLLPRVDLLSTAPLRVSETATRVEPASPRLQDSLIQSPDQALPLGQAVSTQQHEVSRSPTLIYSVLIVWLSIALVQLTHLLRAFLHARRLRTNSWPAGPMAREISDALCRSMGIESSIPVQLSDQVASPQTNGALRPWILLPASMDSASKTVVRDVLAHELAHIKRADPWVVWLEFAARILTGFNPAVWYAIYQIRRERESACDDWVMRLGTTPKRYALSLVAVAESLIPAHGPELAVSCLRSRTHLRRRVDHMLDPKKNHSTRSLSLTVSVVALIGTVGLATARPLFPDAQALLANVQSAGSTTEHKSSTPSPDEALLHAAFVNDLGRAQDLLASGADPDEVYRNDPRTALIAAAREGHWDMVSLLIEYGADVNFHARGDETPLMAVVRGGDPEIISHMLRLGADANKVVKGDGSPLIAASRAGNTEAVRLLLDAGVDPNQYVRGDEAPLFHAVIRGHADIVSLLLDAGADPSAKYDGDGTPLMLAIQHGRQDIVSMLLAEGAEVGTAIRGDGTALIAAARINDIDMTRQLILLGADVDQSVRGDGNALINAARRGHVDVARLLLDAGANANAHVADDDTPLINAVWSGNPEMVQLLLDFGADPMGEGDYDRRLGDVRTPLNQARKNPEIRELLQLAAG